MVDLADSKRGRVVLRADSDALSVFEFFIFLGSFSRRKFKDILVNISLDNGPRRFQFST